MNQMNLHLVNVENGISIFKDSLFLLNMRFRMQNRTRGHLGPLRFEGRDLKVFIADVMFKYAGWELWQIFLR
jgi:hypothetical protein